MKFLRLFGPRLGLKDGPTLKVGVLGSRALARHKTLPGANDSIGKMVSRALHISGRKNVTVGEVAAFCEYGTISQPARPFLGPASRKFSRTVWPVQQTRIAMTIVNSKTRAMPALRRQLRQLGRTGAQMIRDEILLAPSPGIPPPNEPGYAKRKLRSVGSDRTNIATGQMLKAIGYTLGGRAKYL